MAAVTQVQKARVNVNGSYRENYYNLNIATTGDTLKTAFRRIVSIVSSDPKITATSFVSATGVVTFTISGAVTGGLVRITGL